MRSATSTFKTRLARGTGTFFWLATFTFADDTVIRVHSLGTHGNITFQGNTYIGDKSFDVETIRHELGGVVPTSKIDVPVALSANYSAGDIATGAFDRMRVTLVYADHSLLSDAGITFGPFEVGEITYDDRGEIAEMELRGVTQLSKRVDVDVIQPTCRVDLGSSGAGQCNLPLYPDAIARSTAYTVGDVVRVYESGSFGDRNFTCTTAGTTAGTQPTYDYTVGNTTTDGTAVFTASQSWVREAEVATVTDNGDFTISVTESRAVDDWFNEGFVKFLTGDNAGKFQRVRDWTNSTSRVQLWGYMPETVEVGDTLEIMPGCDKRFATCRDRFDNAINFSGEHLTPLRNFIEGVS